MAMIVEMMVLAGGQREEVTRRGGGLRIIVRLGRTTQDQCSSYAACKDDFCETLSKTRQADN